MLYVLDLDDTLYLERDYVRSGFEAVDRWLANNRGVTGFLNQALDLFEAGTRAQIFDKILGDKNITDPNMVKRLVDIYRSHEPKILLLPDAIHFLKHQNKKDLAIITDGYSNVQWKKIKALELEKFVPRIIVTDDLGKEFWKPHTRAFRIIMGTHAGQECQYIADNPNKDFIAPSSLGWAPSIRMRRRGGLHYDLKSPGSIREIATFKELSD